MIPDDSVCRHGFAELQFSTTRRRLAPVHALWKTRDPRV